MQTIKGTVLTSTERTINNKDGSQTVFYELMADFGDGAVVLSSGKNIQPGEYSFTISPKNMYERSAKIKVLDSPGF